MPRINTACAWLAQVAYLKPKCVPCANLRFYLHVPTRNSSGDAIANVNFLYDEARPSYWTATK